MSHGEQILDVLTRLIATRGLQKLYCMPVYYDLSVTAFLSDPEDVHSSYVACQVGQSHLVSVQPRTDRNPTPQRLYRGARCTGIRDLHCEKGAMSWRGQVDRVCTIQIAANDNDFPSYISLTVGTFYVTTAAISSASDPRLD